MRDCGGNGKSSRDTQIRFVLKFAISTLLPQLTSSCEAVTLGIILRETSPYFVSLAPKFGISGNRLRDQSRILPLESMTAVDRNENQSCLEKPNLLLLF